MKNKIVKKRIEKIERINKIKNTLPKKIMEIINTKAIISRIILDARYDKNNDEIMIKKGSYYKKEIIEKLIKQLQKDIKNMRD
jgi:hypothetical protein